MNIFQRQISVLTRALWKIATWLQFGVEVAEQGLFYFGLLLMLFNQLQHDVQREVVPHRRPLAGVDCDVIHNRRVVVGHGVGVVGRHPVPDWSVVFVAVFVEALLRADSPRVEVHL